MTTLNRRNFIATAMGVAGGLALGTTARAANHTVRIAGHSFSPANLTIAAGDSVTFINEDRAPHTATANNGSFDTGRLGRGDSATLTFGSAGSFDYFCAIHPSMTARLTVA